MGKKAICVRCLNGCTLKEYLKNDFRCNTCAKEPNFKSKVKCDNCKHFPHPGKICEEVLTRNGPIHHCECKG
jgi:hypothetical protein